jgi:hypothetical protein
MTDKGLERNNIYFDQDKKYYVSEKNSAIEKRNLCEELKIAFMFEDKEDNIAEICKVVKHVFVPAEPHNINCERLGKNITRLDDVRIGADMIKRMILQKG